MTELILSQAIEQDDAFPLNVIVHYGKQELINRYPLIEVGAKRSALLDFERIAIRRKVYDKHRYNLI